MRKPDSDLYQLSNQIPAEQDLFLRAGLQLTFLSPATSHQAASNFAIFECGNSIPKRQLFVVEFCTIPTLIF
jgi:hypothetical protein